MNGVRRFDSAAGFPKIRRKVKNMIKISKEKWEGICSDYKGEWSDYHGDHPEWIGKKVVMSGCINPNELGRLLIEGVHFEIV